MKTSRAGIDLIKRHESLVLNAYRDPVGVWTIGYGHTSAAGSPKVVSGLRLTPAEAEAILARDLEVFERAVTKLVNVPLTQPQFDALVSFTFNLGESNLGSSTLLRKLNAGDYAGAADEFPRWNKARGKTLPGLVSRRAEERALFLTAGPVVAPKEESATQAPAVVPPTWVIVALVILAAVVVAINGGFK